MYYFLEFIREFYKIIIVTQYETKSPFNYYVQLKSLKCLITSNDNEISGQFEQKYWDRKYQLFTDKTDKKYIFLREQVCKFVMFNVNMNIHIDPDVLYNCQPNVKYYIYNSLTSLPLNCYYFKLKTGEMESISDDITTYSSLLTKDIDEIWRIYQFPTSYFCEIFKMKPNFSVIDITNIIK